MRTLTIEAVSLDSAQGFREALARFDAELVAGENGSYLVTVAVGQDRETVEVLTAIEQHLTHRRADPARLELDGRRYTMERRR